MIDFVVLSFELWPPDFDALRVVHQSPPACELNMLAEEEDAGQTRQAQASDDSRAGGNLGEGILAVSSENVFPRTPDKQNTMTNSTSMRPKQRI